MPITEIHPITATIATALAYCSASKIENDKDKETIHEGIQYSLNSRGEIVFQTMTSLINVDRNPYDEEGIAGDFSKRIRENADGSRTREDGKQNIAFHIVQSFDGYVNPVIAHEIGVKFATELFAKEGYQIQISTHTNTDNIHNHIIISAWNEHGKKYHDCNSSYRLIRQVSDRLAQEYGIEILEATKEYKPIGRKEKDGKWHQYEPTDRKNRILRDREIHEASTDDVRSYRNSLSYEQSNNEKLTQREIVRQDIEELLPRCDSYDQLLRLLREEKGYSISDKKKNGDWLQYVAFTHPLYSKGVRDKSLSEDGAYTRQSLEKRIANLIHQRDAVSEATKSNDQETGIRVTSAKQSRYSYTRKTVELLDCDYRIYRATDGKLHKRKRGDPERETVRHIQLTNAELGQLIDTSTLDGMIQKTSLEEKYGKRWERNHEEEHVATVIKDIQDGLQVLEFLEDKGLTTYDDLTAAYDSINGSYQQMKEQVAVNENTLSKIQLALSYPEEIAELQRKIDSNRENVEYQMEKMPADIKKLNSMQIAVQRLHLDSPEGVEELSKKITQFTDSNNAIKQKISAMQFEIERFQMAYDYLKSIDGRAGHKQSVAEEETSHTVSNQQEKHIKKRKHDRDR